MTEPTLELQRAIYATLMTSAGLAAAMGGTVRAYDRVPGGSPAEPLVFPYITMSEAQSLDDGDTCEPDRFEVFCDLHVWSRTVGMAETKTISGQVRTAILGITALDGWNCTSVTAQQVRHLNDPDGLTVHSVLTFRFLLEPA